MKTYAVPTMGKAEPIGRLTYPDTVTCPNGHQRTVQRRIQSAGWVVAARCRTCGVRFETVAGPLPDQRMVERKLRESDIEARLVARVKALGGEVRKVQWIGRAGAPDRLVMLPWLNRWNGVNDYYDTPPQTIWVEVKAPGGLAKFPKNAHERAQHREHERMRRLGQRVEVVDSYEGIEEILK